jgi:hypothetical protein
MNVFDKSLLALDAYLAQAKQEDCKRFPVDVAAQILKILQRFFKTSHCGLNFKMA